MSDGEDYGFQLAQVEEALSKDPTNADLQKLRTDLVELMALMGMSVGETKPAANLKKRRFDEAQSSRFVKGQTVLAKYAKDGKMYEAVVDAVPSANTPSVYVVVFKGYTSKEKVAVEDVKDFDPTQRNPTPKAVAAAFSNGTDRSSKRKLNNLHYHEHLKQREEEQKEKQSSWKNFASGGKKTSLKTTAPLKKQSMFSTPDDPNAKVGVVGSGKGMTTFEQRGKHVYERTE
ncbi:hypothetical protein BC830DRAFT_1061958 [Chytriomyces sp. MP71]|nr:hypothetical protein BC830DRAFT_1061958 [Chytriomyces sp. MP71]